MLTAGQTYINRKNLKIYVVSQIVTNCTNDRDGELMVAYHELNQFRTFVRNVEEFKQKFIRRT